MSVNTLLPDGDLVENPAVVVSPYQCLAKMEDWRLLEVK